MPTDTLLLRTTGVWTAAAVAPAAHRRTLPVNPHPSPARGRLGPPPSTAARWAGAGSPSLPADTAPAAQPSDPATQQHDTRQTGGLSVCPPPADA